MRLTKQLGRAALIAKCGFCLVCATYIVLLVTSLFMCFPLSTMWNGTCSRARSWSLFWVPAVLNIGTDVVLVIVPFPALMLITERRTRIAVLFVFGLAGIVVIVSTVRTILLVKHQGGMYLSMMLGHIEIMTGVVISALPEVSRSFTRVYLQSGSRTHYKGSSPYRQRYQVTTNGASLRRKENEERLANLREHSQDPINNDFESGSAGRRPDSASQHSALGFHNTASTDQITQYPVEQDSSTDETQWEKGISKTTTFEMKVL